MKQMSRDDFEEVEVLRDETGDEDNVIAVISRNKHTGFYSFGLFKEYMYRGETRRSSFLSRRHSLGVRRLVPRAEALLDRLVDQAHAKRHA